MPAAGGYIDEVLTGYSSDNRRPCGDQALIVAGCEIVRVDHRGTADATHQNFGGDANANCPPPRFCHIAKFRAPKDGVKIFFANFRVLYPNN